ncbi:hypothetical protein [Metamycoplasma equirhinis]|uniref:hypothetical protein n=1 Tax=Metamycoplasma equirhinis TaxID=92402 RepID=UPI00359375D5
MKKKIYLPIMVAGLGMCATIPVLSSSCNFSNVKYKLLNGLKSKMISLIGDVNEYFKDDKDTDIKEFKDKLTKMVNDMQNEKIAKNNELKDFINNYENKFNDLISLYIKLKQEKYNIIADYYIAKTSLLNYVKTELINPKYAEVVKKANEKINKLPQTVDMSIAKKEILKYTEEINNILKEAKEEKAKIG